jgi:hypothetical protein
MDSPGSTIGMEGKKNLQDPENLYSEIWVYGSQGIL